MKKKILSVLLLLFIGAISFGGTTGKWSGSNTHQFLPTITRALLGNGFALLSSRTTVGDCSDGDVTISSGTTSASRDLYYNNLTINGTGVLSTQNQRIFVCGTLDISNAQAGAITGSGSNGANAASATGGSGGGNTGAGTLPSGRGGGAGGKGQTGAGSQGGNATAGNIITGGSTTGSGGSSGAGGAGSGGAGGAARGQVSGSAFPMRDIVFWYLPQTGSSGAIFLAGSGGGGGGGGGDGTNAGGGGGGGGASGDSVYISAFTIKTSASTPANVIQVNGGNGGNGFSPTTGNTGGGGGGAGGGGGWAVIKYTVRSGPTISNAIQATGGTGGTGGTGHGTGSNGANGNSTASEPGIIQVLDYSTGVTTTTTSGAASL